MDVKLISPETEKLLVSSLRSAILDVNGGSDANTAIIKQAKENALGPELACRLVEAFNTSKTLNFLKNNTGEKRAESFELADRDVVVSSLYVSPPSKSVVVTKAASLRTVNFNSSPLVTIEKAAAVTFSEGMKVTKQALYGIHSNAVVAGRSFLNSIKNARDEYRMHEKSAQYKLATSLDDFIQTFKRADRKAMSPLNDIEERLSYHFGPIAKKAIDLAWEQLPEHIQSREKRAEKVPETHVFPLDDELYKKAETLITNLKDAVDLAAEFMEFSKKAELVEGHFKTQVDAIACRAPKNVEVTSVLSKEAAQPINPSEYWRWGAGEGAFAPPPVPSKGGQKGQKGQQGKQGPKSPPKPAPPPQTSKNQGPGSSPPPPTPGPGPLPPPPPPPPPGSAPQDRDSGKKGDDKIVMMPELEDVKPLKIQPSFPAQHEATLRSIRTKLMLNDMISNDPVISGYPVDEVIDVYNQVAEVMPAITTQPLIMRGIIASLLQREGGLDPMELQALLETEEAGRRTRILGL